MTLACKRPTNYYANTKLRVAFFKHEYIRVQVFDIHVVGQVMVLYSPDKTNTVFFLSYI